MIQALRESFNSDFNASSYQQLIEEIAAMHPGALDFRIAETPVFVPASLKKQMTDTCEHIIDNIMSPGFAAMTENSLPKNFRVPGEEGLPSFMVFDFGICKSESGEFKPMLVEMQGFPSLFCYQARLSEKMRPYAKVPENFSSYLSFYNKESHLQLLKEMVLGNQDPAEVVLLEIFPDKQKTRIDFYCTEQDLGIPTVCLSQLKTRNDKLFYEKNGKSIPIKRIYNRMIFEDLHSQNISSPMPDITKPLDLEWVIHPNWFYRISKFTLPFIDHPNVPPSYFLNELKIPLPLNEYVLKPLFSFAGSGVKLNVEQKDLDAIKDPEHWILQQKMEYAPCIATPGSAGKAEIRLFYYWKKGWERPKAIHNLARLSKGEQIGTRFNTNQDWVGGSIAFFEES